MSEATASAPAVATGAESAQPAVATGNEVPDTGGGWSVNEPQELTVNEADTDRAVAEAGKGSKDANAAHAPQEEPQAKPEAEADPKQPKVEGEGAKKEKLVVKGKEYELDADKMKRFAQKGIHFELEQVERQKQAKVVAQREQQVAEREGHVKELVETLKTNPLEAITQLIGPEKARQMAEQWLRPQIEREMLPKEQQEVLTWKERAEKAEAWRQEQEQIAQDREVSAKADELQKSYSQTIIKALEMKGVPKTDFTAAEMAQWMQRGLDKDIEYSPEQLADFVREDNIVRVGALTEVHTQAIETAKKAGDTEGILKAGEALSEMLGKPVVYAIGKYYLALATKGQPTLPEKVLEAPRTGATSGKSGYLTEDQDREERAKRVADAEAEWQRTHKAR